ncbi:MAG: type II toxin-antitoxin system PemK/MazF family toxin [Opitutaceae bacterium]|jgi:mRNA-degrading endonuclease toxin of MazEF toxin-antitoxin module
MSFHSLKQWEIYKVKLSPAHRDPHPVIIYSNDELCASEYAPHVNCLMASSKPPAAHIKPHQVILDEADGLDHLSTIDCRFIWIIAKEDLGSPIGKVSSARIQAISRKISAVFRHVF